MHISFKEHTSGTRHLDVLLVKLLVGDGVEFLDQDCKSNRHSGSFAVGSMDGGRFVETMDEFHLPRMPP